MRVGRCALAMAALVLVGGCGLGTPTAGTDSATPAPKANGEQWVVVQTGSATPSAGPSVRTGAQRTTPTASFLPTSSACAIGWPDDVGQVLIPILVTPVAGGFQVEWPAKYGPTYRITAVLQTLVVGAQPTPSWLTVRSAGGCTMTATITGLTAGAPYIVWLDAPDTPRAVDNSRSLYTGRSGVVYPL